MRGSIILVSILSLLLAGCVSGPKPDEFFEPVSLKQRQIKSRVFETGGEAAILKACSSALLDNGFQVFEAESRIGWISAGKFKHVPGQVPAAIGATVLVHPVSGRPGATVVRLSFHGVDDAKVYQEFFGLIAQRLYQRTSLQ